MRNKITIFLILFSINLSASAEDKKVSTDDKRIAEEVVAIIGNSPVMLSELEFGISNIIEQRRKNGEAAIRDARDEALESIFISKLLSEQAKVDSLDKDMTVDIFNIQSRVDQMVEQAGSTQMLEKLTGKPIYQIRTDLEEMYKEGRRGELMQNHVKDKVTITYDEVAEFYKSIENDSVIMIPIRYTYAHIVKKPEATDQRIITIRERLLEYRRRVLDGESFAGLARLYSQDGSARNGGELLLKPEELVTEFVDAAMALKPGQISEIVETEFGYHIIQLISLDGGKIHARHILLKPEFSVAETQQVSALLDSMADDIRQNNIAFEYAALNFSDDKASKQNGGTVFNLHQYQQTWDIKMATTKFTAEELLFDYPFVSKLKPGEISDSFQSHDDQGNILYKIVKLLEIFPAHYANIDEDYEIIEEFALMTKQSKELDKWIDKTIQKTYVYVAPEYRDIKFERDGWLNKTPLLPY